MNCQVSRTSSFAPLCQFIYNILQALFAYIQFSGITSVGAATSLLMLRTVALWPRKWIVLVPLGLISAGQWGIIFQGITAVKASYNPAIQSCEVEGVHGIFLDLVYLYSKCAVIFDHPMAKPDEL